MNRFHRGYMAPKTSIIQTSSVAKVTKPNDSESFMLMHEVPADDPRYGRPLDGPNLLPDLPGFREAVVAYEEAMHAFCYLPFDEGFERGHVHRITLEGSDKCRVAAERL